MIRDLVGMHPMLKHDRTWLVEVISKGVFSEKDAAHVVEHDRLSGVFEKRIQIHRATAYGLPHGLAGSVACSFGMAHVVDS